MRHALFICLLLLLPLPLLAVTSFTVNGATSGTLTWGNWVFVSNCASSGDRVLFVIFPDYDGDGIAEAGEAAVESLTVQDGSAIDEDARSGWVQFTYRLASNKVALPVVIWAMDSSTSGVSHAYTLTYPSLGQTISGTVYDGAGVPVRGAMVGAEVGDWHYSTITAADGTWSLSVVAGMAQVEVDPNAVPGGRANPPQYLVRVPAGGSVAGLNFRLAEQGEGTISGTVYDATTGHVLPGVDVWVESSYSENWTYTDINGNYSLCVPAGDYTLHVNGPNGWQQMVANITVPPDATFSPVLSRLTEYISGRVLGPGNVPLVGAEVGNDTGQYWTLSNGAGKYLMYVPGSVTYYVGAEYSGHALAYANAWAGMPSVTNADLLMTANSNQISGRVSVTPSGAALPSHMEIRSTTDAWLINLNSVFTDNAGNYSVMLPPGSWQVAPWPLAGVSIDPQVTTVPPDRVLNFTSTDSGFVPTLTNGSVNPSRGVAGMTNFVYQVVYTDTHYRMPQEVFVLIDGVPWPMNKQDGSDFDPSDGVTYVLTTTLPAGTHNYRFLAHSWGYPSLMTDVTSGPTMGNSSLDMPSLSPGAGTTQTQFTASVRYLHTGNVAPTTKNLVYRVDGGSWVTVAMSTTDTSYNNGSIFTWTGTLPAGQIEYYYSFNDGTNALRFPASGSMTGPFVYNITLTAGSVSPLSGNSGTNFTFQVTYTNSAGSWPSNAALRLRKVGEVDFGSYGMGTTDSDPRDGAVYTVVRSGLVTGTYEYYFEFTTPEISLRLPAAGVYTGPTVDASAPTVTIGPGPGTYSGVINITAEATDPDGINRVEFRVDGVLKSTDTTAPYSYAWDSRPVSVPDGVHTLRATAYDTGEHSSYAEVTITTDNARFDDVPKTMSIWTAVEWVAAEGITGGCSTTPPLYCPNSPVTRGQMAVFLCRAMGLAPYNKETPTFGDVPKTNPIYGYVERLVQAGITGGCSANPPLYCPNASITRGQMAVFLCRAAGIVPYNKDVPTFGDVPKTNPQYTYIEGLVRAGITGGCSASPPLYCPTATVTRGQMAVFLWRAFTG